MDPLNPVTYRYRGRKAGVALGGVCGLAVLIGGGLFIAEGASGAGLSGLAVGLGAAAGWVLAMRRIRAGGVQLEPGRIGRVGGGGSIRWLDLDDVALATVHRYSVVLGGTQVNLVLWAATGGDRGVSTLFARAGLSAEQRQAVADAEARAGTALAPFVVQVSDLPEGAGNAVLDHVRHLR